MFNSKLLHCDTAFSLILSLTQTENDWAVHSSVRSGEWTNYFLLSEKFDCSPTFEIKPNRWLTAGAALCFINFLFLQGKVQVFLPTENKHIFTSSFKITSHKKNSVQCILNMQQANELQQ